MIFIVILYIQTVKKARVYIRNPINFGKLTKKNAVGQKYPTAVSII